MEPSSSQNEVPEGSEPTETVKTKPTALITCPYNKDHKISAFEFNCHVTRCRFKKLSFYPHTLELKRTRDETRYLPEEELKFFNLQHTQNNAEIEHLLATEPMVLNVFDFLAMQKARNAFEDSDDDDDDDDDDSESGSEEESNDDGDSDEETSSTGEEEEEKLEETKKKKKKAKKACSVTSEIVDSDLDEEDVLETAKRLQFLELKEMDVID